MSLTNAAWAGTASGRCLDGGFQNARTARESGRWLAFSVVVRSSHCTDGEEGSESDSVGGKTHFDVFNRFMKKVRRVL